MSYTKIQLAQTIVNLAAKLPPEQGLADEVQEVVSWARLNQFSDDPELNEDEAATPVTPEVGTPEVVGP